MSESTEIKESPTEKLESSLAEAGVDLRMSKRERLHHRSLVMRLFSKGRSDYAYPLRMIWLVQSKKETATLFRGTVPEQIALRQMLITVPKKKFRHAVDRVWLRRRIREAYRLNRDAVPSVMITNDAGEQEPAYIQMAFLYVGDKKAPYATIEKKMRKLLEKIGAPEESKESKAEAKPAADE